jgi:tripartite-type tricarboxylate transporter receptor subunit TctC
MKLPRREFLHLVTGAAALPAVSHIAWAQAYPTRPITMIVPSTPGDAGDAVARVVAGHQVLHRDWKAIRR